MGISNQKWHGRMRLVNVSDYLAEHLDVPVAAFEITFRWPTKNGLQVVTPREMNKAVLTELRDLWNNPQL